MRVTAVMYARPLGVTREVLVMAVYKFSFRLHECCSDGGQAA